ncbi:MAG: hemerythrin domain-containing protein [Chloroflexi bacterium]|nr:hemerythrin domain-containing protein [Chloroflexota bacterium]
MAIPTQPLRDEHKELLPHIAGLRAAADSVGEAPAEVVLSNVAAAHEFLVHHLLPHAHAEERALYPVVARLMGAPEATATMSRDHIEVGRLTEALGALQSGLSGATIDAGQAKALRAVLYGLSTLVTVHFAKEEEVYLPILDQRLTDMEARQMFEAMEEAAGEARNAH